MNDLPKSQRVREIEDRLSAARSHLIELGEQQTLAVHRLADKMQDGDSIQPGVKPAPNYDLAIQAQNLVIQRIEVELKSAINAETLDRFEKCLIERNEHRQEQNRIAAEIKVLQQQIRDLEPQRNDHATAADTAYRNSSSIESKALGLGMGGKLANFELSSQFNALRDRHADR